MKDNSVLYPEPITCSVFVRFLFTMTFTSDANTSPLKAINLIKKNAMGVLRLCQKVNWIPEPVHTATMLEKNQEGMTAREVHLIIN